MDSIALFPAADFSISSRSYRFITARSIHSRVGQSGELSSMRTSASYCGVSPIRMTMKDLPHSVTYIGRMRGTRLHSALCLLQAERNHTRQYKRKPIILSQCRRHLLCRRTSRVFSLKRALLLRGVMEMHRLLGHLSEKVTRDTAKKLGVKLSDPLTPCVACSKAKARRNAVPKSTNARSTRRAGRFFVDLGGSMPATSLGGSKYVIICVDDFKIVRFLKKSDAGAALRNIIAENTTPAGLKIGSRRRV